MRVYIAGALTSKENTDRTPSQVVTDYIKNVGIMCMVAGRLIKKGYDPYVPGVDFLVGVVHGGIEEDEYRSTGMAFMEVCDAVLVISDSYGVRQEVERANKLHIPVFYNEKELDEYTKEKIDVIR